MDLHILYHRLTRRMKLARNYFDRIRSTSANRDILENWAKSEGLVSNTWQVWSVFCRQLIVCSSVGCQTRSGVSISATANPPTWERVSYVAICVRSKAIPRSGLTNNFLYKEPTWGNVDNVIDIVQELNPANKSQLLAGSSP